MVLHQSQIFLHVFLFVAFKSFLPFLHSLKVRVSYLSLGEIRNFSFELFLLDCVLYHLDFAIKFLLEHLLFLTFVLTDPFTLFSLGLLLFQKFLLLKVVGKFENLVAKFYLKSVPLLDLVDLSVGRLEGRFFEALAHDLRLLSEPALWLFLDPSLQFWLSGVFFQHSLQLVIVHVLELILAFDVHLSHLRLFDIVAGHLHHFSHLLFIGLLVLCDLLWGEIGQHLLVFVTLAAKLTFISVLVSGLFLW